MWAISKMIERCSLGAVFGTEISLERMAINLLKMQEWTINITLRPVPLQPYSQRSYCLGQERLENGIAV